MKVLVVSEGKHEQSGALENLLIKLGAVRESLEFDRVASDRIHAFHGKGQGFFKRAVRWLLEAQKKGYDALILVIDEDGITKRVREIRVAQDHSLLSNLPRAMGVAIRTFDAWMLADETALSKVLGRTVDRQPNPETIRNPKKKCADLLTESSSQMSQSHMYAQVSDTIDIDILCDRCQRGFKPFATHVRTVFQKT